MELSFGQKYDDNGLVMPWFTHGALDEIKSMDLSDKNLIVTLLPAFSTPKS